MASKRYILYIVFILLIIPTISASVSITDTIQKFEETANRYDKGEISLPQMIVLLEYYKKESERYLEKNDMPGWKREDIEDALKEYKYEYGHLMQTHDINIFLGTYKKSEGYYGFGYSVGARKYPESYYENEWQGKIKTFKQEISKKYRNDVNDFSDLSQTWRDITGPVYKLTYQECVDYMSDIMKEVHKKDLPEYISDVYYYPEPTSKNRIFFTTIYEESKSECMDGCRLNETQCDEICSSYRSKLGLLGHCSEVEPYNFIGLSRMSSTSIKPVRFIERASSFFNSQPHHKKCEPYGYKGRLYFREKLQDSLNKEFFDWYVTDFLGDDIEKYLDPASGFERIMDFLHRNAQKVSESLQCKEEESWPDEFKKINIDHKKGNTEFHISEELRSVDHKKVDMWSTLYRYRVMGDKDMMKKLIKYQLSDKNTIEPPKKEREKVKQEEKAMEFLDKIVSGFGDSLDAKLTLEDGKDTVFTRYVKINDDIILKITDKKKENTELDFTARLSLEDTYDFADRISSIDAQKVYGPSWVETTEPMMIKERIGLIFKLWNSVDIEPWTTKLKLSTKIGKMMDYMKSLETQSAEEKKMIENLGMQIDEEGNIRQDKK